MNTAPGLSGLLTYLLSVLCCSPSVLRPISDVSPSCAAAGVANISNCLTIGTEMDLQHPDLQSEAKSRGLWDGSGDFSFKQVLPDAEIAAIVPM